MRQTFFISRFEESGAEHLVNLNGCPDNLLRESVHNYTLCVLGASAVKNPPPTLVQFEFFLPIRVALQSLLVGFIQKTIFQHQNVDSGAHETSIGVFRGADDGLAPNV